MKNMEYISNQIPGRGTRLFAPCKMIVFYIVTAILLAVPSGVWAVAQEAGVEESLSASPLLGKIQELPVFKGNPSDRTRFDWLLEPEKSRAGVFRTSDGKSVIIANGMVSRRFRIFPNLATTDFTNRMLGESMLRAVSPEGYVWKIAVNTGDPKQQTFTEDQMPVSEKTIVLGERSVIVFVGEKSE